MIVVVSVLLLLALLLGLARTVIGPSLADRLLTLQLIGTSVVAILVLWAAAGDRPALLDVALVLALLTAVASVTLSRLGPADD